MFQHSSGHGRDAYYQAASGVDLEKHNYGSTRTTNMRSAASNTAQYLSTARPAHHEIYAPNGLTLASYSRSATSSPASMDEASSGPDFDDDELDDESCPTPGRSGASGDGSKMKRFRLTHNQTRFLMSEFARQAHPDAAHRERLSREIPGLSPRQVQVWFQNRRAKLKRLTSDDRERMLRSRALPEYFDPAQTLQSPLRDDSRAAMMSPVSYAPPYGDPARLLAGPSYVPGLEHHYVGTAEACRLMALSPTSSIPTGDESHLRYIPVPRGSYPIGQQLPDAGAMSAGYYSPPLTSHPAASVYTGISQMGPTSAPVGSPSTLAPYNVAYTVPSGFHYSPGGTPLTQRQTSLHRTTSNQASPPPMMMSPQSGFADSVYGRPS